MQFHLAHFIFLMLSFLSVAGFEGCGSVLLTEFKKGNIRT